MKRPHTKKSTKAARSGFIKRAARAGAKEARVELRADPDNKLLIERAAALTGQPLSVFVMSAAMSRAREVIREHEQLVLSDRDRDTLLDLLDKKPARPSTALLAALTNRVRLVHES